MVNNEIGGYFQFDLPDLGQFPYPQALKYQSARSALYNFLQKIVIKKIWIPKFVCDSVLNPFKLLNINIQFYDIDDNFFPILPTSLSDGEYLYYVNYFGICTHNEEKLINIYPKEKLIFDHAQAFYVKPIQNVTTIYSPRKFLPVPDGGLLVTKLNVNYCDGTQDVDFLIDQYKYLFTRFLTDAKDGYLLFQSNEKKMDFFSPKNISPITEVILKSLDYEIMRKKRLENFKYLHSKLGKFNKLDISIDDIESPLTYPFLFDKQYTSQLIENNVYSPVYWKDCLKRIDENSFEYTLVNNMTHFVCDHRYNIDDMNKQLEIIKEYLF